MAQQIPGQATTAGPVKQQPAQLIQVSGALGQNPALGQMVIAQPATQPTQIVAAAPPTKGKGRAIKTEVTLSF